MTDTLPQWPAETETDEGRQVRSETMTLNMGPQHPSTHGVLRLVLELDGEIVVKCTPIIGYLHTGIEKSCEDKIYHKVVPLTDRMDYLAPMMNNLAYCLAVEKLLELEIPERAQHIRVMMAELTRISSHLVWLGTHGMDLGATTVFMFCFRERERILSMYEMLSGVRLMSSYIRIGGVSEDIPVGFDREVRQFIDDMERMRIDEYETLLTNNEIFLERTKGVGYISPEDAIDLAVTGPPLRAAGIPWDARKTAPYSGYEKYDFNVAVGQNSDIYDRFKVRIQEMRESCKIARQALDGMPEGRFRAAHPRYTPPDKKLLATSMEALIHHFKYYTEGFVPPKGEVYVATETGKGELGCYISSDGTTKPRRVHFRAPSFINLQALPKMAEGRLIADLIAAIGSIDIVLGEVDR
jgi:NADH-quinone oxidoreductase subunit D